MKATCPRCHVPGVHAGGRIYRCNRCGGFYDDEPDEGGDYHDRDASRRMERKEAREQAQKDRLGRR